MSASDWLDAVRHGLTTGALAPYLGPGLLAPDAPVPTTYEALSAHLARRVSLPRRARGNPWSSAQYVESQRHRATLVRLMDEAFSPQVEPSPFHRWIAGLRSPLIVDTWYEGTMRRALSSESDWVELQGVSRAGIGESRWFRAYDANGGESTLEEASRATTVLYTPHGAAHPARNFLISDADYVEVLTEIDIQSPIPMVVRERRARLGFVFFGCRFHDQMLRGYARQITKRSTGPRFALFDPEQPLTRGEQRFVAEMDTRVLVAPWREVLAELHPEVAPLAHAP